MQKMSWWFVLEFQLLLCATAAGAESFPWPSQVQANE